MNDELLFNKYEIFGVLQNQPEAVKKRIQAIPATTLLNAENTERPASRGCRHDGGDRPADEKTRRRT
jgi:hypothetical protein